MYLANTERTFVTVDQKLIAKLGNSRQRAQARHFDEFVLDL